MFCTDACEADVSPSNERTHDDYIRACERCGHLVIIPDVKIYCSLRSKLYLDKEERRIFMALLIKGTLPLLNLEIGDRLEPNPEMIEYSIFDDDATSFRAARLRVLFWRRSAETAVRHRNPIFNSTIGVVCTLLSIDALHTLNLGVYKECCMQVF